MKIAIVGGGISGLSVAYTLRKSAADQGVAPPEVVVVEKSARMGGNADTARFTFGDGPAGKIDRFADLGVNDFNATSYKAILSVMAEIGYVESQDYRPLENTTSFYTADGRVSFTDNDNPWWGTQMPADLRASYQSFLSTAGKDCLDPKYRGYTVRQYLAEKSPQHGWVDELGPMAVYPRINGMYFNSGTLGPANMPFYAVMHYYAAQEGAGASTPANRMYFVGGTRTWIDKLTDYMVSTLGVDMITGFAAGVRKSEDKWLVEDGSGVHSPIEADIVVLATSAQDSLRLTARGLSPEVAHILAQITYESSVGLAHTDSRLLPFDRNAWSTYNILIHEPGAVALTPYTITYVANRHQNDAANPEYNRFGLPEFFVTLNPWRPIDAEKVLRDASGAPAKSYLHHFIYDQACMQAQADIVAHQGRDGLYHAAGWTCGAGLHEECWVHGAELAGKISEHILRGGPQEEKSPNVATLITGRLKRLLGQV